MERNEKKLNDDDSEVINPSGSNSKVFSVNVPSDILYCAYEGTLVIGWDLLQRQNSIVWSSVVDLNVWNINLNVFQFATILTQAKHIVTFAFGIDNNDDDCSETSCVAQYLKNVSIRYVNMTFNGLKCMSQFFPYTLVKIHFTTQCFLDSENDILVSDCTTCLRQIFGILYLLAFDLKTLQLETHPITFVDKDVHLIIESLAAITTLDVATTIRGQHIFSSISHLICRGIDVPIVSNFSSPLKVRLFSFSHFLILPFYLFTFHIFSLLPSTLQSLKCLHFDDSSSIMPPSPPTKALEIGRFRLATMTKSVLETFFIRYRVLWLELDCSPKVQSYARELLYSTRDVEWCVEKIATAIDILRFLTNEKRKHLHLPLQIHLLGIVNQDMYCDILKLIHVVTQSVSFVCELAYHPEVPPSSSSSSPFTTLVYSLENREPTFHRSHYICIPPPPPAERINDE